MADLSTFTADALRDLIFRTAAGMTKPGALNVSLHAGDPGATGANEVTGGSYARVARNPGDANWTDEVAAGTTKNVADIVFPAPTANWGSITHAGIFDGSGNFIARAPLAVAKTVNNGDAAFKLLAGNCTFVFV
jgi:hypothetical protein